VPGSFLFQHALLLCHTTTFALTVSRRFLTIFVDLKLDELASIASTRLRLQKDRSNRAEPVFPEKEQAINYAENRASFRSGEIRIFDSSGNVERVIPFTETDRRL